MKFIIGKKIEMTQVWQGDKVVAVTRVQAGPCVVTQVKNVEKDGYEAIQVGFGVRKEKNINKPQRGHTKGLGNFSAMREFRVEAGQVKTGDRIEVGTFTVGDGIQVSGVSKGKGFQGVVRRHGFSGSKKTHGNKDQLRMPGSAGATGPAHVFKGMRMGGRMGGDNVTTKNLEIVEVDVENNILSIKGAVPGARNGLVLISGEGELIISAPKNEVKAEAVIEEKIEEVQDNTEAVVAEEIKEETKSDDK